MQESLTPGPPSPTIAIRGLGTDGQNKAPATAVYVDGVVISREDAQFYDLARVEILRGPQGTLYGGNATGGAVNIITNDPTFDGFSGSGQLDVGNYSALHTTGVANLPLSDTLAARFAFNQIKRDNYYDSDNGGGVDKLNARVKILYKPSDTFSLLFGVELYRDKSSYPDALQAQDDSGNLYGPKYAYFGLGTTTVNKYYATLNWDLGFAVVTYIPAFQHLYASTQQSNTLPGVGADCRATPAACNYLLTSSNYHFPLSDVLTQELRLANAPDSKISWVAGLYYKDYNSTSYSNFGADNLLPATRTEVSIVDREVSQSYAAFAQATVPVSETLRVTAGVRASADEEYHPQTLGIFPPLTPGPFYLAYPYNQRFHSLDGLLRVETDLTSQNLLYASASSGYRPGGPAANGQQYATERVRAYEVGSKNRLLDNQVQLNLAAYLNNYPNFQNNGTIFGPNGDQADVVVGVPARFYGVELEAVLLPTPVDRLSLSPAWESARYTENTNLIGALPGLGSVTESLPTNGQAVPHAPRWNISGQYDHTFKLANGAALVTSVDAHYQSQQLIAFDGCIYAASICAFDTAANPLVTYTAAQYMQKAYTLTDASVSYSGPEDKYTLTVYGRNLTNESYKVGNTGTYGALGAPRVVGVSISAKF